MVWISSRSGSGSPLANCPLAADSLRVTAIGLNGVGVGSGVDAAVVFPPPNAELNIVVIVAIVAIAAIVLGCIVSGGDDSVEIIANLPKKHVMVRIACD
jgi:hypothetical protein